MSVTAQHHAAYFIQNYNYDCSLRLFSSNVPELLESNPTMGSCGLIMKAAVIISITILDSMTPTAMRQSIQPSNSNKRANKC